VFFNACGLEVVDLQVTLVTHSRDPSSPKVVVVHHVATPRKPKLRKFGVVVDATFISITTKEIVKE
jgi:hypothetical protein